MAISRLISILVPNYNYSQYIGFAIEGLVGQTFSDLELVIIDDGSSDDSRHQISKLEKAHKGRFRDFKRIFKEHNTGKLSALNIGVPLLKGEFTIILDADDWLAPDYIERTLDCFQSMKSLSRTAAFVYTDCRLTDNQGTVIGEGRSTVYDTDLLMSESYIPECALTLTRALREVLPFNETIRIGTKHHKWLKLAAAGWTGIYLPLPLFHYRMHDRNLSGIGARILDELKRNAKSSKILAGYWPK